MLEQKIPQRSTGAPQVTFMSLTPTGDVEPDLTTEQKPWAGR